MKCRICASLRVPVSAKMSAACIPCKSSTVCVSNTFFTPLVCADAEGSVCCWTSAGVVLEICRLVKREEEVAGRGGSLAACASWRRRSVEAIVAVRGLCGVVEGVLCVGAKRDRLIRQSVIAHIWLAACTVPCALPHTRLDPMMSQAASDGREPGRLEVAPSPMRHCCALSS